MDIQKLDCWVSLGYAIPATTLMVIISQFLANCLSVWTRLDRVNSPWTCFHFNGILGLNLLGVCGLAIRFLPTFASLAIQIVLSLMAVLWAGSKLYGVTQLCWGSCRCWRWSQWLISVAILFTLGPALAYPSGWDELCYHLELPRRWWDAGGLGVQLDLPYSALPSLLEIIFTLTYPIESLITPRLLVWVVWLHGLLVFRAACGQACNSITANCLTLAMVASPCALFISANCYVESVVWANMACVLLMSLSSPIESQSRHGHAIVMGVFIGGAIAIKITSVGLLCFPILLALLQLKRPRLTWPQVAWAILAAGCFASPFYFRTWFETGNPFTPFFAQWFTSDPAWVECSRYHHDLAVSNFGMRGLPGLLIGPGALAFAYEIYDGSLGSQWLLMILLLAVAVVRAASLDQSRKKMIWLCLSAAALFYGIWFLTSQQARFAIPLVMVVILAAGIGIETYRPPMQRWWRLAIVACSLASIPWINFGYYLDSWFCVLKVRTPVDYIRDGVTDSYTELALFLHESIEPDAQIISLFEHRLAYLPRRVEIGTPFFQVKYFRNAAEQTADNLMVELRAHNVDYVVLTTNPLGPDVSSNRIADQQRWFQNIDQCIANGQLNVIWKSEQHAVASVANSSVATGKN